MNALYLRHDPATFWSEYWREAKVDPPQFIDLDIYPIFPTIKYLRRDQHILECGFGGGRVIRHLVNNGFRDMIGVEYDFGAAQRLRAAQELNLQVADVRALPFRNATFDVAMAFGVLGGLHRDTARALHELIRVVRPGGLVIASLMIDNLARRLQRIMNEASPTNRNFDRRFYAWMDTEKGWESYLESFGLEVLEWSYMLSRYNFYYWSSFLRKKGAEFDHAYARVCDKGFALNALGEAMFHLTSRCVPGQFAGAALYVCRRQLRLRHPAITAGKCPN